MGSLLWCPTRGKVRFQAEAEAAEYAEKQTAARGDAYEPYLCPCDGWHIRNVWKARNTADRLARKRERLAALKGPPPREFAAWEDDLILSGDLTRQQLAVALNRSVSGIRARHRRIRRAPGAAS